MSVGLIFPVHIHECLIHCSDDIFVILVGRSPLSLIRDVSNYYFVYKDGNHFCCRRPNLFVRGGSWADPEKFLSEGVQI